MGFGETPEIDEMPFASGADKGEIQVSQVMKHRPPPVIRLTTLMSCSLTKSTLSRQGVLVLCLQ